MEHVDAQEVLEVATRGRGLTELTGEIARIAGESSVRSGLCVVFCRHTSASLVVQENADPSAARDLIDWFGRIAPDGDPRYSHDAEGPDDMAAHLRTAVTSTSETIPVVDGRLALGTWQGVYLFEHRTSPHRRQVVVHVQGTGRGR